ASAFCKFSPNPKRSFDSQKFRDKLSSYMSKKVVTSAFKSKDFVHLHVHTDYSLLQSTIQLKPLAKRLKELDMKACAITDYGNMYGAVSFFNAMKSNGIKPIIGYEAYLNFGSRFDRSTAVG